MPSLKIMYTNTIMTYITNTQKGEVQTIEITNLLFLFKKKKKKKQANTILPLRIQPI